MEDIIVLLIFLSFGAIIVHFSWILVSSRNYALREEFVVTPTPASFFFMRRARKRLRFFLIFWPGLIFMCSITVIMIGAINPGAPPIQESIMIYLRGFAFLSNTIALELLIVAWNFPNRKTIGALSIWGLVSIYPVTIGYGSLMVFVIDRWFGSSLMATAFQSVCLIVVTLLLRDAFRRILRKLD